MCELLMLLLSLYCLFNSCCTGVTTSIGVNVDNTGQFVWPIPLSQAVGQYWVRVASAVISPPIWGAAPTTGSFAITNGSECMRRQRFVCLRVMFRCICVIYACLHLLDQS
jgi:hypothetical protein